MDFNVATGQGKRRAENRPSTADGVELYRRMLLIRRSEERLSRLFADGEVPGFIHLSIGQEAVSVGIMSALTAEDTIASTHRGHGHAIAKGLSLTGFFAELLARDDGLCRGRGGSMHVADAAVGMLGANGIVGAGVPIALGSALAHSRLHPGRVAVSFFGDGALAEGVLHESLNLAVLLRAPILFVCEANGWSEFSPVASQIAFGTEAWARSYGLVYEKVDGNDVFAVAEAAARHIGGLRSGGSPVFLECLTARVRGHYEGDAQKYREAAELDDLPRQDPLARAWTQISAQAGAPSDPSAIDEEVLGEIEAALAAARRGPEPSPHGALCDVYSEQSHG
ncbi:thiamine pyrophosphate-dependent dehydrogenase E1 component subunit alpha [Phenylobacterium sp.]|uniref:thiamine pyrophosphate-dependent dehydrogenase E1 component subunit alpha n=1 Tax=Phenylobacterium sp. TaxID=1871053 RepID=UPI002F951F66